MSDQRGKADQPVSVAQIAADDRLLDALGRGEPLDADLAADPAAAMLAAWRDDLAEEAGDGDLWDDLDDEPAPLPAGDPARKRRLVQAILGAAAAAVVAMGLAVSAHQAQPGSVLWPVSKVVYPQRAEVKAAEKAIADAATALAEGRNADAQALLTKAGAHIARIDDEATAARLRGEVEALQRVLNAATAPPPPAVTPTPAPAPTAPPPPRASRPAPGGSPGAKPAPPPEGGAPSPTPSNPGGGLLPRPPPLLPLPPIQLPTLPPILPGGD
ncbi:anti-sigma-D factor RsdA [Phytohabitans sp. ZYX-F-186]|uniref:Anti-sigma-D factor RsdA n=1 Tax=Phytohabitans maris TaxID=3071409 RepID=A0ABU0ZBG1_9ACTN|nr:anti-sigma-D factor RsdA [Phytohabitans sp. ZYX-F-186]MDQ7904406.1 anti-sigma-D factor RsdA [Phytohabitans sp. ZYX-F-186]